MEQFERPRVPVVITGLADGWPAKSKWTTSELCRNYGSHRFEVCYSFILKVVKLHKDLFPKLLLTMYPHCAGFCTDTYPPLIISVSTAVSVG